MKLIKLSFVFSNLNAIVLGIWILFLIIVAIRFFRPAWVKNISFFKLILIALGLNIFYGLFVTWAQYHVWATTGDIGRQFLNAPLSKQVPLSTYLNWTRPLFENHYGFFLFYILGRVWLNILISFLISGVLYSLFKIWKFYRGGFLGQGPEILLVLMLISGFPGVLILIPVGFIFTILLFGFHYAKIAYKKIFVNLPVGEAGTVLDLDIVPAFMAAALFTLVFSRIIMLYVMR